MEFKMRNQILTDAQLKTAMAGCEYCEEKGCTTACPANCSPMDFIRAALQGRPPDFKRAAAEILGNNPLGGVCGWVCPDRHCQSGCSHLEFDSPVNIPAIQATVIQKAYDLNAMPEFEKADPNGKKVAVVGAGPAGIGAAAMLAQKGYEVEIFEKESKAGGACNWIPDHRLPKDVIERDIDFALSMAKAKLNLEAKIDDLETLLEDGYDAVIMAAGLTVPMKCCAGGEELAIPGIEYLSSPCKYNLKGNIAVIGGGATAGDCATTAKLLGADRVEMFALEHLGEMPLTKSELDELLELHVEITGRVRVKEIVGKDGKATGLKLVKISHPCDTEFDISLLEDLSGTEQAISGIDHVIVAIGAKPDIPEIENPAVFFAGDCVNGPTTVVEAVAAGKNVALQVDAFIQGEEKLQFPNILKSEERIPGFDPVPVPLNCDFFGRPVASPFLISASPPSDGLEQVRKAYEAGWPGVIMKTAFKDQDIHIPNQYMEAYDPWTYGNCDNVSGHPLSRVCGEIKTLVKEWPDRLTLASTGGPVTGDDEDDCRGWQENTKRLEEAGAMGIEYSLSCPQGGEGTEGDIVSQSAKLTAKVIGWVMEVSDPAIPKLFKLTPAVTSPEAIVSEVRKVFEKYPGKKAGITLANTFPVMSFRPGNKKEWEEGIVFGMSGAAVAPITYLSLAKVASLGVAVSANGGAMDYMTAANFLALGAVNVQVCTIVMKEGYGIINDLESGLSHMMLDRGIKSVKDLIGIALPEPILDFMDIPSKKSISSLIDKVLCMSCGNCARCGYLAIELDEERKPVHDPEKCIGCSICVKKCFSGALEMRDRTPEELEALKEK
ncbi:MAG: FAD-dependent oxidoreductase [Candidatus Tritonobacter lacicola]|nr:FAD-dependent oxidoreductase [Candidatus Tritonobacter lacicola]